MRTNYLDSLKVTHRNLHEEWKQAWISRQIPKFKALGKAHNLIQSEINKTIKRQAA